jgi:hypothetical protein
VQAVTDHQAAVRIQPVTVEQLGNIEFLVHRRTAYCAKLMAASNLLICPSRLCMTTLAVRRGFLLADPADQKI